MPNIDYNRFKPVKPEPTKTPFNPEFIGPTDLTWLVKLFKS